MNNGTIRVGIIGCGMITQRSQAPGLAKVEGMEIAAVCDTNADNRAKVREEHAPDATEFDDYHKMLGAGLVDAVSVATPVFLHCPMTVAALEAGCHVLCEKPMAMSAEESGRMVEAAATAGKVLQINLSRRYKPFFQGLAKLVHEERIGAPRHLRAIRVHANAPDRGWSPGANWFVTKASGGGIVGDIGVHVGDMMQWFFGEIESVRALTDSRREDIDAVDNAAVLFRFRNGATGMLELSWTSPANHMSLEIHGSDAMILAGATAKDGVKIVGKDKKTEELTEAELSAPARNSFECFADAIRGVAPSPAPGEVGHAIQRVIDAIHESGEKQGAPVEIGG